MEEDVYIRLNAEEHQTKIPGSHMILAALEYCIGTNRISYFDVDKVSELLNLPERCIASEIITFGYPADENQQISKKHFDEIIFLNKFQEPK